MDNFDPKTVSWVLEDEDLQHLLSAIASATEFVFDLETTELDEHAVAAGKHVGARIVLASFTLPMSEDDESPTTWVLPLSHPDSPWLGSWRKVLRSTMIAALRANQAAIGHNVKFDARWVAAQVKVDVSALITWDSMVSSHLLDENRPTKLKVRAPETFDVPAWDDFDLSTPGAAERVPMFDLGFYAGRDTYWTWRLARLHRQVMYALGDEEPWGTDEIEAAKLGRLAYWCDMPTVATLAGIEQRGMVLDVEWTRAEREKLLSESEGLKKKLAARFPELDSTRASFAPTSTYFKEFADLAVKAGDLQIAQVTPNGRPAWSRNVLVRQARQGSTVAQDLLAQRGAAKKAEFLTSWLNYVTPAGLIHSTYHVGSVVSGRLSSSGPNLQQVTSVLKPAFVPRPGYVFADFDYGQIELRIAAFISRSEPMIEAFRQGKDLHTMLAADITGKSLEDVQPSERQYGKVANFALLYKMGAYGFREFAENAYGVSLTLDEAEHIHATFYSTWEGIGDWHERTVQRAERTGQVSSPLGRIRRVPQIWSPDDRAAESAGRQAINSPVQGMASNLLQMAAASIAGRLPGVPGVKGVHLVGTVHDSLLAEIPEDNWRPLAEECQRRMVNIGDHLVELDCVLDVPLAVNVSIGSRWGLHDIAELS